tara:strand:- start:120 stop:695 length:576 start_codon:yes stop_codon:yes gene_type:complete
MKKMSKERVTEHDIQKWLSYLVRGRREQVLTNVGRVDIVIKDDNYTYVVEVKDANFFLSAIGQVIGYAESMPRKEGEVIVKILALFNFTNIQRDRIEEIYRICGKQGITVWLVDVNLIRFLYDLENNQPAYLSTRPSSYFLEQFRERRDKESRLLEFRQRMATTIPIKTVCPDLKEEIDDLPNKFSDQCIV